MGLLTRTPKTGGPYSDIDRVILCAGEIADEAILGCFIESAAYAAAQDRTRARELDRKYPGYRQELNKRRAAAGLPPL